MEEVTIQDNRDVYRLFFDEKNLKIQVFTPYKIEDPFHFLNFFQLSSNTKVIKDHKNSKIILDLETNLTHYYHNGIEDYRLLFQNNGESTCLLKGKKKKSTPTRQFRIRDLIILCTLSGLLLSLDPSILKENPITEYVITTNITLEELQEAIMNSSLTQKEKEYLYNEDFLTDILPLINQSNYSINQKRERFEDISIESYTHHEDPTTDGYYSTETPNVLFIKNYQEMDKYNKDVLSHEFTHLCQDTSGYRLIIEACAEIISFEYYSDTQMKNYPEQVKLVKTLMEIIGPEVIWNYNFTGDFKPIEEKVKPFFSEEEYQEFLTDLDFDYEDSSENQKKFQSLSGLLDKLYERIYHEDISNNKVISLIREENPTLVRYYFNKRYRDQSYYLEPENGSYQTISYDEAIASKKLIITMVDKRPVSSYEEAMHLLEEGEFLTREIVDAKNMTLLRRTDTNGKTYITCFIDNQKYEDMDLDELVSQGCVKVNYYHIAEIRELSYEEYQTNNFPDTVKTYLSHASDTELREDGVYCFVPLKVDLPPIHQESYQYTKKIT